MCLESLIRTQHSLVKLFEIVNPLQINPPTYKLKDLKEGELIEGTFYEEELQRVHPENGNA